MFKYNVQIQKVSGSLNESVLPNKNLVIKSKTEKSNEQLFAEASEYYKNKYGLVIESADVTKNNYKMFEVGETYDGLFLDHWGYRNTNDLVFKVVSRNEEYIVLKCVNGDFDFPKQAFKRKIRIDMRYKSFAQEYVQLPKAFWVDGEPGIVAVNNSMG